MSTEQNKAVVRRYFEELVNQRKLAVADELFARTFGSTRRLPPEVPPGPARAKYTWSPASPWLTGFPDWHVTIDALLADDDQVAARISAHGTHLGELRLPVGPSGLPVTPAAPTGQAVRLTATVWFTFAGGRIADITETADFTALLQALGIRPVSEPDPEANKAVVRRAVEEVWSLKNPAAAYELYADEVLADGRPFGGPQAVIDDFRHIHASRPDIQYTINALVAEGDTVVLWYTGRGTHLGEIRHPAFGRVAPTGKQLTGTGIAIYRLADGKIVAADQVRDALSLGRQLGVIPPPDQSPPLAEVNKAVVRRLVEEVWNGTNPAAADDILAADTLVNGQPFGGPQAARDANARTRASRPDIHWTINTLVAEGDLVVLRWTSQGTRRGRIAHPIFGQLPPTGQRLTETGINIHRVVGGKIVETWGMKDSVQLGQQLGVLPIPGLLPPSLEANKAVVRRLIEEVWNRTNPAAAEEIIAPDRRFAGRPAPPQAARDANARIVASRPDMHWTINDLVAEGDKVVVWWTSRGTHLGELEHPVYGRVAPTGKPLTGSGISIHRVVDGKLVEGLVEISDQLGLGQQLGVLPAPGQAS